jgi:tetratricopeptide (TPR) repeat protein
MTSCLRRSRRLALAVTLATLPLWPGCQCVPGAITTDDAAFQDGMRLFLAGNHSAAASQLRAFLAKNPAPMDAADAHYCLGAIALKQGDTQGAESHFRAALGAARNDSLRQGAEIGLARCTFVRGDYRQCREACQELLRDGRASSRADEVLFLLAEASERAGLAADARQHYQQVIARFPNSPLASSARTRLGGGPPPSPGPSAAPPAGGYTIQVAALATAAAARDLARRLEKEGYAASVAATSVGGRELHTVRVGPYTTETAAQVAAGRLRTAGYRTVLIRP